ncbi:MAG TPA: hypothetical protein VKE96_18970 [Vicinamibacterales bacterium]|nr:hypothetical protein [Vicinamibacterales bacterium]
MTTFAAPGLDTKVPDPCKHVNYTLGMVLGVDDFNQEFAYTHARLHLLARDSLGYGTLTGLAVAQDSTAKGPRITVTSGAALLPPGQLVCVRAAQCGYINDWLAAHKAEMPALLGSPVNATLPLYLTLCYRDCPVDPVPIPGEPCRSESELMAPSRLVDDFVLEFRTTPPDQREEDLLREFVAWLRLLTFGSTGPFATIDQFIAALRASVQEGPASPPASPLSSPLAAPGIHFVFGSPLTSLVLDRALAGEYYRAAFRIWTTEIRPRVLASCCEPIASCGCGDKGGVPSPDECLLLARIDVPVVNIGGGEWRADDTQQPTIDESRRPILFSLRLLEEWVLGNALAGATPASSGVSLVAAGIAGAGGTTGFIRGHLSVAAPLAGQIRVLFDNYAIPDGTFQYVVHATALVAGGVGNPVIAFDSFAANGILLRVTDGAVAVPLGGLATMRFMIDVTRVQA